MRPFAEADRAASRLEALLAEQHVALRTGQLETLGAIGPRLERAMGLLTPGVPPQQLARLREMAAENARLIRAALSGIAEVRSLRTGAQGTRLSTYDASGRLSSQAAIGQTLARR
ncbi:MAG: FlgN protein [Rhodobacteraceae bacterium HLUCCO18]|nr:MAG: FlgN protein [Rhodobacteraceae bacterium HLUCCO18]